MVIALSGALRSDAGGRKTLALARAVNHVLSGLGLPLSRVTFGQVPDALHESINYALRTVRVVVTPTGDPWRVSATLFARMIDLVQDRLRETDPAYGTSISRQEIAAAIVQCGYMSSKPPPIYTQPALTPVATIIMTPGVTLPYYEPPIREIVIQPVPGPEITDEIQPVITSQIWEPVPIPDIPDIDLTPVVLDITETTTDGDNNTLLIIVGGIIGGLALASMMKRGGRYERTS